MFFLIFVFLLKKFFDELPAFNDSRKARDFFHQYPRIVAELNRKNARQNHINSLQNYWLAYYHLRRLTLYDYQRHQVVMKR